MSSRILIFFFSLVLSVQATNITFNAAIVRPRSSITDLYAICNSSMEEQWEVDHQSAGFHLDGHSLGDVVFQTNSDVTSVTTAAIRLSRNSSKNQTSSLLVLVNTTRQNHQIACREGATASTYNYTSGDSVTDSVRIQRDGDAEIIPIEVNKGTVIFMCTTFGTQEWLVNGISVGGLNSSRPGHHNTGRLLFGVWIILHVSSNLPSENDLVSILVLHHWANTNLTVSCKGKSGEANSYILDGTVGTTLDPGSSDSSSAHSTLVTTGTYRKWSWGCGINCSAMPGFHPEGNGV